MAVHTLLYRKILVPLDGSGFAEVALPHAVAICQRTGASLILLRVVPPLSSLLPRNYLTIPQLSVLQEQARAEAEAYLRSRAGELRGEGCTVKAIVKEGSAVAQEIVDTAVAEGVDLIVMSTHGRSGVTRWVYGSVAAHVLAAAPVPVLLIRAMEV